MDIFFVILIILTATSILFSITSRIRQGINTNYLWLLFCVHFICTIAYLLYSASSASDSVGYYLKASGTENWLNLFKSGTFFISFLTWIFSNFLGLSYYATMLLFSFFGFIAIFIFYIAGKENVNLPPTMLGMTLLELIFLLPNIHFWSSSIGKGSVITLGLALLAFGLSRFNRRFLFLVIGGFLVFMVRSHILFAFITSIAIGSLITQKGIRWYWRFVILTSCTFLFFFMIGTVTELTDTDSLNVLNSSNLINKANKLSRATSGVDIQNYGLAMKLFTFLFRPLFFDGLSAIGFLASIENVILLFIAIISIRKGFLFWSSINGWFRILIIFFLIGSVILSQISGNLGIALRQKAQLQPFFFIFFCKAVSVTHANTVQRLKSVLNRRPI